VILFIDELHTLVGAGAADGAMDASNMLKPALARGELRCIGATTLDEHRKHIEKDAAFARRFPDRVRGRAHVEDTIAILRGLKERYEVHHGIRIQDSALVAAATLSHRYITDRFLPDKAIDLVDEAASKLKMEIDSMPIEIDACVRKVTQLEIERQALTKEEDGRGEQIRLDEVKQRAGRAARGGRRDAGPVAARKGSDRQGPRGQRAHRAGAHRPRARQRTAETRCKAAEVKYGDAPCGGKLARGARRDPRAAPGKAASSRKR
jgi:ATP-dependent Clp protease ATP-binding subunit ClpB